MPKRKDAKATGTRPKAVADGTAPPASEKRTVLGLSCVIRNGQADDIAIAGKRRVHFPPLRMLPVGAVRRRVSCVLSWPVGSGYDDGDLVVRDLNPRCENLNGGITCLIYYRYIARDFTKMYHHFHYEVSIHEQ